MKINSDQTASFISSNTFMKYILSSATIWKPYPLSSDIFSSDTYALIHSHSKWSMINSDKSLWTNAYILTHFFSIVLKHTFQVNWVLLLKSIGITLRIKDQVLDSGGALQYNWYQALNQEWILNSGGALNQKDKFLISALTLTSILWEIYFLYYLISYKIVSLKYMVLSSSKGGRL